jgi:large conductance mechanosensitive channel
MSLIQEFRAFALKGNVVDLAVGVIIGAAFGKIVDSLVKHVIMPTIAALLPFPQTYTAWKLVVNGKEIPYGLFLGEVINFVVVAAAVFFFIVKFLGWVMSLRAQEAVASPDAPPPPRTEVLLAEIRDLLKARKA